MGKILFLITPNPPYEQGEEYLSSELPVLAKSFDQIIVIHHAEGYKKRDIPYISELIYFSYLPAKAEKLKSIWYVFSWVFWRELFDMIFHYHLFPTPQRIASLLGAIAIGKKFARFVLAKIGISKNKVYVYSYWCNFIAVGLAFLKRRSKAIICLSRAHGYDVYFDRNESGYLPLRRFIYKNIDRVYFISKKGFHYAKEKTKFFPAMRVSYLGSMPVAQPNKNKSSTFQIVSCSWVIPVKRINLIIDALALLNSEHGIKWTHFGDGSNYEEMIRYAKTKISKKSHLTYEFKGYVSNDKLLDFYSRNSIDLFINVSESEGLPFSIIEAFSFGIPALATNVGGTNEIVESAKNGILLDEHLTAQELTNHIEYFISLDEQTKAQYSQNAYLKWKECFNAEKNFQLFIDDFI
jgi:glycosyltransferase involved in cell wall biosynthesis